MKHLKDLDYYLMGTFNFPVKPVTPKGAELESYEETRGMTGYMEVLSDKQRENLEYEWKLYHINQSQFKEFIMGKHAELKTDIMNEFNLSEGEYKALIKVIRKRGLTATIELIYMEAINTIIPNIQSM